MNKNIEHQIKQTLQSLEGIERARANPFLFGKVMNRLESRRYAPVYGGRVVFRYAFLILMLAGINLFTIYRSDKKAKEKISRETLLDEYFINTKTFEY